MTLRIAPATRRKRMPKFKVTCLRDAFVVYATKIEADTPQQAHAIASSWEYDGKWKRIGVREFDDCEYPDDEIELVE
jgi:hypothetical protein